MSAASRLILAFVACLSAYAPADLAAAAERSVPMESWAALQKAQADELLDFAAALDAKDGSFDAEARAQAVALAKKLDPTAKAKDPAKKPMAAEDQLADKALRDGAAARDKAREDAEKSDTTPVDARARVYPKPENARERFEALRFEMLADQTDFAAALSPDPNAKNECALRLSILKGVGGLLGAPKWACEKALMDRIGALSSAKYAPWSGAWETRLGTMTIEQNDAAVTGSWRRDPKAAAPDGTFTGTIKDHVLSGAWRSDPDQGTFTLTLSRNDVYWKGISKTKTETHPLDGKRVDPTAVKPEPAKADPVKPEPEKAK